MTRDDVADPTGEMRDDMAGIEVLFYLILRLLFIPLRTGSFDRLRTSLSRVDYQSTIGGG